MLVAVLFCLLAPLVTQAADLDVMCSGGFAAALRALAADYEAQSGVRLHAIWGPSMGSDPTAIPQRLARNESADVVILAASSLETLLARGKIVRGSETALAESRIAMAVRAGAQLPDISTVDALRRTLLAARSVAYSDSASGVYLSGELFERMGIAEEMAAKSRAIQAEPVGKVIARGDAEVGFQQLSELKAVQGITIVGLIPEGVQKVTVFSAGIVNGTRSHSSAAALIAFLRSAAAERAIRESGLDPPSRSFTDAAPSR